MPPCTLGCVPLEGHQVLVFDRGGRKPVGEITGMVSFLKYGRELDDDSECEVSVHFRSDAAGRACCEVLEKVRTWRHEIVVQREGERVWEGPLVNLSYQRQIGHLTARDVMAWADVRVVRESHEFTKAGTVEIAAECVLDAFKHHDDVGLLDRMALYPGRGRTDLKVVGKQQTAGEVLRNLARAGLDFTVLGRSLILGEELAFGPLGPLTDEHFLRDVEVEERGLSAATRYYLPGKDVEGGVVGECGGVDAYYGLIERAVETFSEVEDKGVLDRMACHRVQASNPPPLHVHVPDGAQLAPHAPVCLRQLVPGAHVDLDVSTLCRRVRTRQRLTAVQVKVDDRGEEVTVTVAPYGPAALALSEAGV